MMVKERYIPAASYDVLTPLYDPALRYFLREATWKQALVAQAGVRDGMTILDVGCGTGTLTIQLAQAATGARIVGLDGDSAVLAIARRKAARHGAPIAFVRGLAVPLPFRAASFDRVVVSLVLHHLTTATKRRTVADIFRVMRPGGEVLIADFGTPHTPAAAAIGRLVAHFEEAADHVAGRLPDMVRAVGFEAVDVTENYLTVAGTLALVQGRRPAT